MHDLFERTGEFARAVVADTPADLGDAQALFFQQQVRLGNMTQSEADEIIARYSGK